MHNSKCLVDERIKALVSAVLFLILVCMLSMLVYAPYRRLYSTDDHYQCLVIGASQAESGIDVSILKQKTGKKSYMMAAGGAPLYGRYAWLESALKKNNIDTVVLDLAYDIMPQDQTVKAWSREYQYPVISKLGSYIDKLRYCTRVLDFSEDEYDKAYMEDLQYGIYAWEKIFSGEGERFYETSGMKPQTASDQRISEEEAAATYNTIAIDPSFREDNVYWIERMISICQEHQIRMILINTPMSEKLVWQKSGLNDYHVGMQKIADQYGCEYYDFNLYKNRQSYLTDADSFYDENHLSESGAEMFSMILGEMIVLGEHQDVSEMFYNDYDEARTYSVYATGN